MLSVHRIAQYFAAITMTLQGIGVLSVLAATLALVVLLFRLIAMLLTTILQTSQEIYHLYTLQYSGVQLIILLLFSALLIWTLRYCVKFAFLRKQVA